MFVLRPSLVIAWLLIVLAGRPLFAEQRPAGADQGERQFAALCVVCHGTGGAGGEAPSLNRPNLDRAPTDESLRSLLTDGIPNRMPAIRHLSDAELQQVVAYVRSLGRTPSPPPPGDPQNGLQIYRKTGCASCHIVGGDGGSFGPVLTEIGSMRSAQYLRQSVIEPGAALPRGTLSVPARDLHEFLPVRVVTRDGREIVGVRLNEDTLTIQLRDGTNQLHSFRKADLQQLEKQLDKSLMPSYRDRLPAADLDDLVAYLSSLRGGK